MRDDVIICRCMEISRSEIIAAIKDGARDITGVMRRTRAGMGLCQGKTCRRLVAAIIAEVLNIPLGSIPLSTARPPVRPVSIGMVGGERCGRTEDI